MTLAKKGARTKRTQRTTSNRVGPCKASRAMQTPTAARAKQSRTKKTQAAGSQPTVIVVNMIPKSLSGESNQDSEPTITINPSNPLHIPASAFTPDPAEGSLAPIYLSTDGGLSWSLNSIVPSVANASMTAASMTADITVAFGAGDRLYAGIIRLPIIQDRTRLNILRTDDFHSPTPMQVLVDHTGEGVDQPYVQALAVADGPDKGKDRLYVGDNDFNSPGKTATIDQSLDAGNSNPPFSSVRVEARATSGQDGPPVRPCPHADGTVYAAFHSWQTFNSTTGDGVADVVLARDDNGGHGAAPFTALKDSADGTAGNRVARGVKFNFGGYLGLQRTGGDVAIAVDPTDSSTVYVAYNDDQGSNYQLHLVRSRDRGATWSGDLQTIESALDAALAVNSDGRLALLYQQLVGSGAAQAWVTRCTSSTDCVSWQNVTLASTPANKPPRQFDPYLGDYEHLTAVGKDFYGIFSASNVPDMNNFPSGVTYQRNANFNSKTLLDVDNVTPVQPSIDLFFFKMTPT